MRTLKFYGSSDDLFEIDGTGRGEPDEIGCFQGIPAVKVANEHTGLIVVAVYAAHDSMPPGMPGCWTIGLCPIDEDIPLPHWDMRWSAKGYSTLLEVDVPDDVIVSMIGGEE
ncbi:hypothetical protein [Xanthobacter sediminis]